MIDAHQHFWHFDPVRDAWITKEMQQIRRDFLPVDLQPELEEQGIDGCVSVQADQSVNETFFLLELAEKYPFINGVVGWVDLLGDEVEAQIEQVSSPGFLKGIRHIVQAEPPGFMLQPRFIKSMEVLKRYDLTYDVLIYHTQLDETTEFLSKAPEMPFIIDHVAKPDIRNKEIDSWKKQLAACAQYDYVHCKLSGLVTEADWNHWTYEDLKPYMDAALDLFGPDRLVYGSDWPVCLLGGAYAEVFNTAKQFIGSLSEDEQDKIMGLNAIKFYNLDGS